MPFLARLFDAVFRPQSFEVTSWYRFLMSGASNLVLGKSSALETRKTPQKGSEQMLNKAFKLPTTKKYTSAKPFPHIVLNGFWEDNFLGRVARAVEEHDDWDGEKEFYGSVAKRWCSTWSKFPRPVNRMIQFSARPEFIKMVEKITGEEALIPDPYLEGAGIHSTADKGFLKLHADFNWHSRMQLYRRLNLLVYLNKDWDEGWGGNLDLARETESGELAVEQSVFPHFNTTVIFTTDDQSFHGQPEPMSLPVGISRNSIALYYYVARKPETLGDKKRTGTDYRKVTGEKMSRKNSK